MPVPNPLTPPDSADERPGHEPSMEEILASIRRIISDDQSLTPSRDYGRSENGSGSEPETPGGSSTPKWPYANTQREDARPTGPSEARIPSHSLADRRKAANSFKQAPTDPQQFFSRQAEPKHIEPKSPDFIDLGLRQQVGDDDKDSSPRPVLRRSIEPAPMREEVPIVSPATDAAVATSFNALFASQLLPNPEMLTEMARDMLRPMLKAWLDDNLPVMVERLVRAEIERVARGGR